MASKVVHEAAQSNPLEAAEFDRSDVDALIALREYRATPDQQKLFMAWFLRATGEDSLEFRADARISAFASGKRWIWRQFAHIVYGKIVEVKT